MRLRDKIAIVTGAGSGIGRATAMLFAHEGALLVLNDIDAQSLDKVAAQVGKDRNRAVAGDVAKEDTARRLAEETIAAFGRIDVLVNNAGIHLLKDVTEMSVEEWDRLMDINLKSMFLCCKHVIPRMLQRRKGSIVNLASISSFIGQEVEGASTFAYNITKAGALQLTKSLASRYAAEGFASIAYAPATSKPTSSSAALLRRWQSSGVRRRGWNRCNAMRSPRRSRTQSCSWHPMRRHSLLDVRCWWTAATYRDSCV
jgi:NAD(P)-dependent dehydrogenase (short-subunit alcohol dehydrogenase family)